MLKPYHRTVSHGPPRGHRQLPFTKGCVISGTNESKVSLIECLFQIKGTGTLTISASSEDNDLTLIGNGKYGLRPDQLKFGNDKQLLLSTDSNVESYLMITEFRRN